MSTCFHFEDVGLCIYSQTLLPRLGLAERKKCQELVSLKKTRPTHFEIWYKRYVQDTCTSMWMKLL